MTNIDKYWSSVPWDIIPPSAKVDMFMLFMGIKPAMRLCLDTNLKQAFNILKKNLTFNVKKFDNVIYVSKSKKYSNKLILIDNAFVSHEKELGKLLGYPVCCCTKIKSISEDYIDAYEDAFLKNCIQSFCLDTRLYRKGIALISHVPCSVLCLHSLTMAKKTLLSLTHTKGSQSFSSWKDEVLSYFNSNQS